MKYETGFHKMPEHESAQCGYCVHDTGNGYDIDLISYVTTVCGLTIGYDGEIKGMYCNGLYSRTTIKHIGWFARLFGLTYYDFKALIY